MIGRTPWPQGLTGRVVLCAGMTMLVSGNAPDVSSALPPALTQWETADGGPVRQGANSLCPGSGNCCVANGTPGCSNFECCDWVCFLNPLCCDYAWTANCVEYAFNYCDEDACVDGPCPGVGECCTSNGTAGCADGPCCHEVCGHDPFCCEAYWDSRCADYADLLCPALCGVPRCAGRGDCCEAHRSASCRVESCCQAVCSEHPACCETEWAAVCAEAATTLCPEVCGQGHPSCPGEGDCCSAGSSPACADESCCNLVCAVDPYCCSASWDSLCAATANGICTHCSPPACPGAGGSCCRPNRTPGCDDLDCCAAVCLEDPYCCGDISGWDQLCVDMAEVLCGNHCECQSPGDFDGNQVVDLADLQSFQLCFGVSTLVPLTGDCTCADFDDSWSVGLADFAEFYLLFAQP